MTDEVLIVAYDYNSQQPRFFSKFYSNLEPPIYNVTVGNATGASSAAPTFFDPKFIQNQYNLTELQIDGGIICNNPSLYAYQMARLLEGHDQIRVMSIGTGEKPFTPITSVKELDKKAYLTKLDEFMMNMDVYTADFYLRNFAFKD